jgi:hypothetical protein
MRMDMRKWFVDGIFVRDGKTYDRNYYIREDGVIEWREPIPNGETHEFPIGECYHESGDPIMVEDGELLGELVETSVEQINIRFAWGPTYPYADTVPVQDVKEGESGIEWYSTKEAAHEAIEQTIIAWQG